MPHCIYKTWKFRKKCRRWINTFWDLMRKIQISNLNLNQWKLDDHGKRPIKLPGLGLLSMDLFKVIEFLESPMARDFSVLQGKKISIFYFYLPMKMNEIVSIYSPSFNTFRCLQFPSIRFGSLAQLHISWLIQMIINHYPISILLKVAKTRGVRGHFCMFGSYESTFYHQTTPFYGTKISCLVKKLLSCEGPLSDNFPIETYGRTMFEI